MTWSFLEGGYVLVDVHFVIYTGLLVVIVYLLTRKSYKPQTPIVLTPKEINELITTWKPTPFVPELPEEDKFRLEHLPVVSGYDGIYISTEKHEKLINCGISDYLGLAQNNDQAKKSSIGTLRETGTGACGPRNFYGTLDVHLTFEEKMSQFIGTESTILYASGLATTSSVIPCFANREDYILCDEGVKKSIQLGNYISRANVKYFRHNDVNHLEQLMIQTKEVMDKEKKLTRRWVIVEGVYYNTGSLCRLREVVALSKQYRFRVLLDDSVGLGTLGATGRGSLEHFGLKITDIDIYTATIQHALGSLGGVCCADNQLISYQRINGSGYLFSASNPPYLATCATTALEIIEEHPEYPEQLRNNTRDLFHLLKEIPGLELLSEFELCPFYCIRVSEKYRPEELFDQTKQLQQIVDEVAARGVAVVLASASKSELVAKTPNIRLSITTHHTPYLQTIATAVREAFVKTLEL